MEEQTSISPTFLKGFNQGYQMQQHKPEMSEQLLEKADMENEYWQGFEGGTKEYVSEKSLGKDVNQPSKDRGMDREK